MWAEKYVGIPYTDYNCAEISRLALKEQFNYDLILPQMPKTLFGMQKYINSEKNLYEVTDNPQDGDLAIMRMNGRISHIGVVCEGNYEIYIMHAMQSMNATILTNHRLLKRLAIKIVEFRTWRK